MIVDRRTVADQKMRFIASHMKKWETPLSSSSFTPGKQVDKQFLIDYITSVYFQ